MDAMALTILEIVILSFSTGLLIGWIMASIVELVARSK